MAPSPRQVGVRRMTGIPETRQQPDMRQQEIRQPDVKQRRRHRKLVKQQKRVRVATANIGSMVGRSREVAGMLGRRKVVVCVLQEVRYKKEGTRMYGSGEERYKF